MNELATAIVAFTLGVLLSVWAAVWLYKTVWRHASHCAICKQRFIDALEEHEDNGTPCFWKKFARGR
jgi:hypothetical protein